MGKTSLTLGSMRFSNRYRVQEDAVAMPMRTAVIGLFPRGVVGAELTRVPARLPLWPEEWAPVSRASDARAREFAAGRHCARSVGPATFEIAHRDRVDSDHWSVARSGRFLVGERHVFTAIAWRPANDDSARVDP